MYFLFDGVPFPLDPPPDIELPPPTQFEQVCGFVALYLSLLSLLSLLLPRPWYVALFRIGFPFMPEKLERNDD